MINLTQIEVELDASINASINAMGSKNTPEGRIVRKVMAAAKQFYHSKITELLGSTKIEKPEHWDNWSFERQLGYQKALIAQKRKIKEALL